MGTQNTDTTGSFGPIESISQVYRFLGRCFSYPEIKFCEIMRNEKTAEEIKGLVEGLPFEIDFKGIPSPSLPQAEFESRYINNFDITPPCPLYESSYPREDMAGRDIYEDLLRFYEHFDIRLNEDEKDYPDHLVTELEFMAYLTQKEAYAEGVKNDSLPYQLAQMDFMERHLSIWIPELNKKIQERVKESFYKEASSFMIEFLKGHLGYLRSIL